MVRSVQTLLIFIVTFFILWITCTFPSDPAEDPKNVTVSLFSPDNNNTVNQGSRKQIGMRVTYPQQISSYRVTSSCGNFDTTIQALHLNVEDTIYFNPKFQNPGTCTLKVSAKFLDTLYKEITGSLVMVVLPGAASLDFSAIPAAFTTHTGASDTLRFVLAASNAGTVSFAVTCTPELNPTDARLITPVTGDTVAIHFDPAAADTYTVTLKASAGSLTTSASVTVTVLESIALHAEENPQTLITGTPDTLIFTLTPEQVARGVSMQLLDALNLPPAIAKVIPCGTDSIIIAVNPTEAGELSFSIATTNGTLTDTASYTFTFVDQDNAVWTTTSATVDAVEGRMCSVDLTPWLFTGVLPESIAPKASVGSITGSGVWSYTLPWGSNATVSVTITGKRGELSQNLFLTLNVAPGDSSAPKITLLSPATENKSISSSQASVSVIVRDSGAGVDKVTFKTTSGTVDGNAENDTTWSATITGLIQGTATQVIITATDKSMKKNSSFRTISLTYDPTIADGEPPVFTQVGGPHSGDRVTIATGTITFTITDDSDVDSFWWTLDSSFISAVSASDDDQYIIAYTLTKYGKNTIKLYAKDGSSSGNEGSRTISLNYNTAVTAVTPSGPLDGATDVSLMPSFTWTGGTDADGDSVFYRVLYGTSATALSQMTSILTGKTVTLESSAKLTPTTVYYWQAVAWSKAYPDTVRSEIISFTTLDPTAEDHTGPQIAQTAGPENGDRVTAAAGTITLSVTDPNNVASVTAKLNTGTALPLTAGTNSTYVYNYTLTAYGANTVTFTAIDGSANANSSSDTITINYNTEPAAVTLTSPPANATGVSISPTFKWSGGDDADGDGVLVSVRYGTSTTNLAGTATVVGTTATISTPLAYNQTYYWQVTATSTSTAFPDVVRSSVGTFSTEGSLPTISAHPQSQTKEEGQGVTFNVTASANGFGTLSYQWRTNGTDIAGQNAATYTITSVTTGMNGTTYDCLVKNAVGTTTSNAATLTVTAIPSFTVGFDMHGGIAIASQTVLRGGHAQEPPAPVRSGFVFKGWYTSSTFTTAYDFGTPITSDRTIHARWAQVYSVSYNSNGADGGNVPRDTKKYESGEMVTVAGNTGSLNKDWCNFGGWTTNPDGSGTALTTIQVGSSDIQLYAKWIPTSFQISYYVEGGPSTPNPNPTTYTAFSPVTFVPLSRTNYIFDGWYTSSLYNPSDKIQSTEGSVGNKQVYCRWIVAKGSIDENGTVVSGTGNFTCVRVDMPGGNPYCITVDGHSYTGTGYTITVNPTKACSYKVDNYQEFSIWFSDCVNSSNSFSAFTFLILEN